MQLEKAENPKTHFQLSDECFPFSAQMPGAKYQCKDWNDVAEMLLNAKSGRTSIQHARSLSVRVGKKWKPISLESISFNPLVAHYLSLYSRATAPYIHGYLFPGELSEQPHIIYGEGQALDCIKSAIDECELENIRTLKQQSKENG